MRTTGKGIIAEAGGRIMEGKGGQKAGRPLGLPQVPEGREKDLIDKAFATWDEKGSKEGEAADLVGQARTARDKAASSGNPHDQNVEWGAMLGALEEAAMKDAAAKRLLADVVDGMSLMAARLADAEGKAEARWRAFRALQDVRPEVGGDPWMWMNGSYPWMDYCFSRSASLGKKVDRAVDKGFQDEIGRIRKDLAG